LTWLHNPDNVVQDGCGTDDESGIAGRQASFFFRHSGQGESIFILFFLFVREDWKFAVY
jgi:hypothetical protein